MNQLKGLDKLFWVSFEENLEFIDVMKSGKGTPKIYDTYVKKGAKKQVNLPNKGVKAIEEAIQANDWNGPAWKEAVKEIKSLIINNSKDSTAVNGCIKMEKLMQLEALQKM